MRRVDRATLGSYSVERPAADISRRTEALPAPQRSIAAQHNYDTYQRYAALFEDVRSPYERDLLVVRRMTSELTSKRGSRVLTKDELQRIALVIAQGPVAQRLERTKGKAAGVEYVTGVLMKEQATARNQAPERTKATAPKVQSPQKPRKRQKKQEKGVGY